MPSCVLVASIVLAVLLLAGDASASAATPGAQVAATTPAPTLSAPGGPPAPAQGPAPRPAASTWLTISDAELAAEPREQPARPKPKPPPQHWYGWQLLLADAATLSLYATSDGADAGVACVIGYAAIPPAIHFLHGQGGRAALSAGMRLGLPVLGAVAFGYTTCGKSSSDDDPLTACDLGLWVLGVGLGVLGAIGVDAVNAYEPVERGSTGLLLVPQLAISDHRSTFGLAGSF
jgi:hypothetical protein